MNALTEIARDTRLLRRVLVIVTYRLRNLGQRR